MVQVKAEAIIAFGSVIEQLQKDLERYAQFPQAKPAYIQKQNAVITQLCNIFNYFNSFEYLIHWYNIENAIQKIEQTSNHHSGYYITLVTNPNGNNQFCQIK